MEFYLLMPFCFSGFMNIVIVSGCVQGTIKGRCNETHFCFCTTGEWWMTSLTAVQTHLGVLTFNNLCTCSGASFETCLNSWYVNEFQKLSQNEINLSDENCAVIVKNTTINDTSTTGSLHSTTTESLTTTELSTTTELLTTTSSSTTRNHLYMEQTTIGNGGQNCCCSSDYEAKVQYWLNETNQRLHKENLPNSLIEIKDELMLETKNLSASKSLRICAPDQRYSAAVAGYVGAFVIGLVLSVIILMDCSTFITSLHRCMSK